MHLGALAGAWLVAVAGFGGMRDHGDTLEFSPRLPPRLSRLQFRLVHRNRRLRVEVTPEQVTYEVLTGEPLTVLHHGERLELTANRPESLPSDTD